MICLPCERIMRIELNWRLEISPPDYFSLGHSSSFFDRQTSFFSSKKFPCPLPSVLIELLISCFWHLLRLKLGNVGSSFAVAPYGVIHEISKTRSRATFRGGSSRVWVNPTGYGVNEIKAER